MGCPVGLRTRRCPTVDWSDVADVVGSGGAALAASAVARGARLGCHRVPRGAALRLRGSAVAVAVGACVLMGCATGARASTSPGIARASAGTDSIGAAGLDGGLVNGSLITGQVGAEGVVVVGQDVSWTNGIEGRIRG